MSTSDPIVAGERHAVDGVRILLGVGGLIALVIGIFILVNPEQSGAVAMKIIAFILAIYAVITGVVYLGVSIFSKSLAGWPRTGNILLGLLYLIAGIVIFANVGATAAVLAIFLAIAIGVVWIIEGVLTFTTLKSSGQKTLTVIFGIVSLVAGLVLIFSPWIGALTLWLLIGISLIVLGVVQVIRAFSIKTALS